MEVKKLGYFIICLIICFVKSHYGVMSILRATGLTYSKTCVKQKISKRPKIGFQDQLSLNAGQKYSKEHSAIPWSILQYFQPSLSYHLSSRSLFCVFWSGNFTQDLLYYQGAQWLSGRVLDSRLNRKGRGFEPHQHHCVVVLEQEH